MYFRTWHEFICKCGTTNWVDAGDITNITGYDPEGCTCYNCGHNMSFNNEELDDDIEFDIGMSKPEYEKR